MYEINSDTAHTVSAAIGEELELSDIFYTNNKKRNNNNNVFQVKLSANGLCLRRESASGTKEQHVSLGDIVGGRCMRSNIKQRRSLGKSCTCSSASTNSISRKNSPNKRAEDNEEMQEQSPSDASAYLYVFAYVLKKNLRSTLRRERTVLTLRFRSFDNFEDNIREAERWCRVLRWHKRRACRLHELRPQLELEEPRRRLLVLLNPKSGSGKARELFHQQVVPVLNEAEVPYDLYVTKHANYARDFVRIKSLAAWVGIVAIGGDGLFFEIINGLLQRSDWQDIVSKIPVGIVPSGSGNGLARTIAHLYGEPYEPKPILGATLTIISGNSAPMDVVRIQLKDKVLYSFLSAGWGLISDIDIESERLRSLGYQRFTIWTLHRLISLRTYRGRVSYLLKSDAATDIYSEHNGESNAEKRDKLSHSASYNTYLNRPEYFQSPEIISFNEFDDVISLETSVNQSYRSRCDSWFSAGSRKSTFYSIPESIYHSIAGDSLGDDGDDDEQAMAHVFGPASDSPLLQEALPESWVVEEGEFIMVHAAYQTHLGTDCFFAPSSKLHDGTIYLVIIRGGTSRTQLFNFLVNMSSGTHLPSKENPLIKVVPVTAFRIEPFEADGIITVDGERVDFGALQGEVLPGITRVMVPK